MARRIALMGLGKIARDQHLPAIAASHDWDLAATVSRSDGIDGVENHEDLGALLEARRDIATVVLALPPQPRFDFAAQALRAGRNVMLEKPPGQTLAEVDVLIALAREAGVTLFATWHSRMAPAVAEARRRLADTEVRGARITWTEDVREWHPGQDWVFDAGGMGVFDTGINALSIMTEVLPAPVHLTAATLQVPGNRDMPIAANLHFTGGVSALFDWRKPGPPTWEMRFDTAAGEIGLHDGGCRLTVAGQQVEIAEAGTGAVEYPALYARMAELVAGGDCDVDLAPMVHVADAFTLARREVVEPFSF